MPKTARRLRLAVVAAQALLVASTAAAQGTPESQAPPAEAPPTETPPDETTQQPTQPTPEEMQQLMQSMGADVQQSPPAQASQAPASAGPLSVASSALSAMNPAISVIMDAALGYFSQDQTLQTGDHDPTETGFKLQQVELHAGADVDPFFRFDTNIVFGQDDVELEEAFATTMALPANLQVRAGQFLTRFGRINPTHPHAWNFVDQPWVMGKFMGSDGNRGLGIELSWLAPLPWYVEVVTSMNESDGGCCNRSFYGDSYPGVHNFGDFLYTGALKQFFPFGDDWSLSWGLSAQFGPNSLGHDTRTQLFGTDLYLRYRPVASTHRMAVSWQTEALYRSRGAINRTLDDWGAYTQLVWNIDPEWEVGGRYEFVDGVPDDPLDPDWVDGRQRGTAQITFYPSHFSRLRLQGSYADPKPNDPYWAAMLALEVLVGAHGAHVF